MKLKALYIAIISALLFLAAYSTVPVYGITLPDGTRLQASEVRTYSLSDITEDHPMYEILNQTIQQQFGVEGGIPGLTDHANQWVADQPARWREERRQIRRQERRFDLIISLVAIVVILGYFGVQKLRPNPEIIDSEDESEDVL